MKIHDGELLTNLAYTTNDDNQNSQVEPFRFKEARQDTKWQDAMTKELKAFQENKTWTIVPFHHSKKAIGSRWVYKIKHNLDEIIE